MPTLVFFNKPYGVLSQFTPEGRWRALDEFIPLKGVYVAGRLDADSEGLLILTDDGKLQARIADPKHKLEKTYWAQVEGIPDEAALDRLRAGIALRDFTARPAKVRRDRRAGRVCGRATRRFATARRSRLRGWKSAFRKARTARYGGCRR